jgi:hypothetical protein
MSQSLSKNNRTKMHSVLFLLLQAPSSTEKKEEGTILFFNIFPLRLKPGERPLAFGHGGRGTRPAPSDERRRHPSDSFRRPQCDATYRDTAPSTC